MAFLPGMRRRPSMLPPNLPSDIKQSRLIRALEKSGFVIDFRGGKGSHVKAVDQKSGKFITVQNRLYKIALVEILKEAEKLGYDAAEIMRKY